MPLIVNSICSKGAPKIISVNVGKTKIITKGTPGPVLARL